MCLTAVLRESKAYANNICERVKSKCLTETVKDVKAENRMSNGRREGAKMEKRMSNGSRERNQ